MLDATKAEKVGLIILWIIVCAALSNPLAYLIIHDTSFVGGGEHENFSYVWITLISAFFGLLFGSYGIFKLIMYRVKKTGNTKEIGVILAFVIYIIFLAGLGAPVLWNALTSPDFQFTGSDVSFRWYTIKNLFYLSSIIILSIIFIVYGINKIRNKT